MDKRTLFQDKPSHFYLLTGRIIGFLTTAVYLRYMIPKFMHLLNSSSANNGDWILAFYLLSIAYVCGFLVSFWKVGLSGLLLVISSLLITLYFFIDSKSWVALLSFIPLSFSGFLFLIYWKKCKSN